MKTFCIWVIFILLFTCSMGLPFNQIEGHELYHHYMITVGIYAGIISGIIAYIAMGAFSFGLFIKRDADELCRGRNFTSFEDLYNFYSERAILGACYFIAAVWPLYIQYLGIRYIVKYSYQLLTYIINCLPKPAHIASIANYGYVMAGGKNSIENKITPNAPTTNNTKVRVEPVACPKVDNVDSIEKEAMEEAEALCPTLKIM